MTLLEEMSEKCKAVGLDVIYEYDKYLISDEIIGSTRWGILHRAVFQRDDEFVGASYETGATEYQDDDGFDPPRLYEVEPYREVVFMYREKK
jgi:hypothetical protein